MPIHFETIVQLPILAQANEGFFDKYLNIAKLFDSPIFFGIVVGSGALFFGGAIIFLFVIKNWEKKIAQWGKNYSQEELVALLEAGGEDTQNAFAYLRKHSNEQTADLLIAQLKKQREDGKYNPKTIYLLEDIQAVDALPLLEQIANGKSRVAGIAKKAHERISAAKEETDKAESEAEAKA